MAGDNLPAPTTTTTIDNTTTITDTINNNTIAMGDPTPSLPDKRERPIMDAAAPSRSAALGVSHAPPPPPLLPLPSETTTSASTPAKLRPPQATQAPMSLPPGATGLTNLGNTCFMNSALQCLSNTPALTAYFLSGAWCSELNQDNPLGTGGLIPKSYAALVAALWRSDPARPASSPPRDFKSVIGQRNSTFQGYGQQDSHELLQSLLDGLHEDLNRIRIKEYVNDPEMGSCSEAEFADISWAAYRRRNDSIIVDLFQALLKNRTICMVCSKVSIKFDPYMYLQLPVPEPRDIFLSLIILPRDRPDLPSHTLRPRKSVVVIPKSSSILDLKTHVAKSCGWSAAAQSDPSLITVVEIFQSKIFKTFDSDDFVSSFSPQDVICVVELEDAVQDLAATASLRLHPTPSGIAPSPLSAPNSTQSVPESLPPTHDLASESHAPLPVVVTAVSVYIPTPAPAAGSLDHNTGADNSDNSTNPSGPHVPLHRQLLFGNTFAIRIPATITWDAPISQSKAVQQFGESLYRVLVRSIRRYSHVPLFRRKGSKADIPEHLRASMQAPPPPPPQTYAATIAFLTKQDLFPTNKTSASLPNNVNNDNPKDVSDTQNDTVDVDSTSDNLSHADLGLDWEPIPNLFKVTLPRANVTFSPSASGYSSGTAPPPPPYLSRTISYGGSNTSYHAASGLSQKQQSKMVLYPASAVKVSMPNGKAVGTPESSFVSDQSAPSFPSHLPLAPPSRPADVATDAALSNNITPSSQPIVQASVKNIEESSRLTAADLPPSLMAAPVQETLIQQLHIEDGSEIELKWDEAIARHVFGNAALSNTTSTVYTAVGNTTNRFRSNESTVFDPIIDEDSITHADTIKQRTAKTDITLSQCLAEFSKEEILDGVDTMYCSECKEHRPIRKTLEIYNAPNVLVVQLKRFSNNGRTGYSRSKIDVFVDAPMKGLDMTPFLAGSQGSVDMNGDADGDAGSNDWLYDLYAVSNHFGGLGGGHYTAYVKNPIDNQWYHCDDSRVLLVGTGGDKIVTESAYLLFYVKRSAERPNLGRVVAEATERFRLEREEEEEKRQRERALSAVAVVAVNAAAPMPITTGNGGLAAIDLSDLAMDADAFIMTSTHALQQPPSYEAINPSLDRVQSFANGFKSSSTATINNSLDGSDAWGDGFDKTGTDTNTHVNMRKRPVSPMNPVYATRYDTGIDAEIRGATPPDTTTDMDDVDPMDDVHDDDVSSTDSMAHHRSDSIDMDDIGPLPESTSYGFDSQHQSHVPMSSASSTSFASFKEIP